MTALVIFALLLQQPNLEQQARLSLDRADKALTEARSAYSRHEMDLTKTLVLQMETDVETARESLAETGKDARRRPKHFKFGEMRTRDLLKRIASFENEMELEDRPLLVEAKNKVQEVHDSWLLGIMGDKK